MKTTTPYLVAGRPYNPKGGAPHGNRNALQHGRFTADKRALRRQLALFMREALKIAAMAEARANTASATASEPSVSPTLPLRERCEFPQL